jgi:NAD(P)H dehydrogenase (quinone)
MATSENIVVTGATGQLGRLVLAELSRIAPSAHLIGLARNPSAATELAKLGVELRKADYGDQASVDRALTGADKVLLISSSEIGQRLPQHRNVIEAAKRAGVKLLAYTSLLHADRSPLDLAIEHHETEGILRASGIPVVLLRNGWYTENYTGSAGAAIEHGAVLGASKNGRISAASRADFAAAAAAVLTSPDKQAGKVYELAGDGAFTLEEYATELARQSGKTVVYKDLSEGDYKAALQSLGLPEAFAALLAESSAKAATDVLRDDSRALSRLIGRPTTPLAQSVSHALA